MEESPEFKITKRCFVIATCGDEEITFGHDTKLSFLINVSHLRQSFFALSYASGKGNRSVLGFDATKPRRVEWAPHQLFWPDNNEFNSVKFHHVSSEIARVPDAKHFKDNDFFCKTILDGTMARAIFHFGQGQCAQTRLWKTMDVDDEDKHATEVLEKIAKASKLKIFLPLDPKTYSKERLDSYPAMIEATGEVVFPFEAHFSPNAKTGVLPCQRGAMLTREEVLAAYQDFEFLLQHPLDYYRDADHMRTINQLGFESELQFRDSQIKKLEELDLNIHIRRDPQSTRYDGSCYGFWAFVQLSGMTEEEISEFVAVGDSVQFAASDEKAQPVFGVVVQKLQSNKTIPECDFCFYFTTSDVEKIKPETLSQYMKYRKLADSDHDEIDCDRTPYIGSIKINEDRSVPKRVFKGLKLFSEDKYGKLGSLKQDIIGQSITLGEPGAFWSNVDPHEIDRLCADLSSSQQKVFKPDEKVHPRLSIVQGPPGTGKTELVAIAATLNLKSKPSETGAKRHQTIIVAPTHVGANVTLERTASNKNFDGLIGRFRSLEAMVDDIVDCLSLDQLDRDSNQPLPVISPEFVELRENLHRAKQSRNCIFSGEIQKHYIPELFLEKYANSEFPSIAAAVANLADFLTSSTENPSAESAVKSDEPTSDTQESYENDLDEETPEQPTRRSLRKLIENAVKAELQAFIKTFDVLVGVIQTSDFSGIFEPSLVIVDGSAMVLEIETLALMGFYPDARFIFVGDHRQLGPWTRIREFSLAPHKMDAGGEFELDDTEDSKESANKILPNMWALQMKLALQTRLILATEFPVFLLTEQHRCVPSIREAWGLGGYESRIKESETNTRSSEKEAQDFVQFTRECLLLPACRNVVMLDIRGSKTEVEPGTTSSFNKAFANAGLAVVKMLVGRGFQPEGISIVTPYKAQRKHYVSQIKQHAAKDPDDNLWSSLAKYCDKNVKTVNSSQGFENSIIIVDLTVSSEAGNKVIFAGEKHRLNVALSRAKHGLVVIGDAQAQRRCDRLDWTAELEKKPARWFWNSYLLGLWLTQNKLNARKQLDALKSVDEFAEQLCLP